MKKINKNNVDFSKLKNKEVAIMCDTEEKAKDLIETFYKNGFEWKCGDECNTCFSGDAICYDICDSEITWASLKYYKDEINYEIIEWEVINGYDFKYVVNNIKNGEAYESKFRTISKNNEGSLKITGSGWLIGENEMFDKMINEVEFKDAFTQMMEGFKICSSCSYSIYSYDEYLKTILTNDNVVVNNISTEEMLGKWRVLK